MTIPAFLLYLLWFEILYVLVFCGAVWWYIQDTGEDEDVDL